MSITKEEIQAVDTAVEEMIAKIGPIILKLPAGVGYGSPADCHATHGWGLFQQGANYINKAKALVNQGEVS